MTAPAGGESRNPLVVYGYVIVYKPQKGHAQERWAVDQDDEYANLPAHYLTAEEALDPVTFLRSRNIEARMAALIAEVTNHAEGLEANRTLEDD